MIMNRRFFLKSIPALAAGLAALPQITANLSAALAQSFIPAEGGLVEFVDIQLQKTGSPTGRFWAVMTDKYMAPLRGTIDPSQPARSDAIDVRLLGQDQWVRFIFRNPAEIRTGERYHAVIHHD